MPFAYRIQWIFTVNFDRLIGNREEILPHEASYNITHTQIVVLFFSSLATLPV